MPAHAAAPRRRRSTVRLFRALVTSTAVATLITVAPSTAAATPFAATPVTTGEQGTAIQTSGRGPTLVNPTVARRALELKRRVNEVEYNYAEAVERADLLDKHAASLEEQADRLSKKARQLHRHVEGTSAGGILSTLSGLFGADSALDEAAQAADNEAHARSLADAARKAASEALAATEKARLAMIKAQAEAADIELEMAAHAATGSASRQAEFGRSYHVTDPEQDARNRRALARWQAYLDDRGDAGIVPPTAKVLTDPERLPRPFTPVTDARGRAVPGIAEVDRFASAPVTVLPAETIRAVSEAFSLVGLAGAADAVGSDAFACGGLAETAWGATRFGIPADSLSQWQQLANVPAKRMQAGDLVVLGDETVGIHRTGVYLGDRTMIAADASTGQAGVEPVDMKQAYGAKRIPLPATGTTPAPTPAGVSAGCGEIAEDRTVIGSEGGWTWPVADGSYSLSAGFGSAGELWSAGVHTGQDFASPSGTPVYAVHSGVVSVEQPSWAGNLVRIDHGGGVETWYAHLSEVVVQNGQRVTGGTVIGAVGNEGNSTGPHLHFEVRLDDEPVDPMAVLRPGDLAATSSVFQNGEIPESVLCPATTGGHLLSCDAAVAYRLLDAAFEDEFGVPLCITDSYRSRAGQESLFQSKPTLAAVPGTSNHGWGVAVDLCGGVESFGSPEHDFVVAQGPTYGWHHPDWAGENGNRPEAWHFEFASGA
jgi:murein DD-endopeptidase MepM/ murein hydrolase activator NlpD